MSGWMREEPVLPGKMSRIVGFVQDDAADWAAMLDCGHTRHFRHDPPWQERAWVMTEAGREGFVGLETACVECGAAGS